MFPSELDSERREKLHKLRTLATAYAALLGISIESIGINTSSNAIELRAQDAEELLARLSERHVRYEVT